MAYNETTGILSIDTDNETFDEILDNVAKALGDYRVTSDPGFTARDVGLLCTSPNINKWARKKPSDPLLKGDFGLDVPSATDIATLSEKYNMSNDTANQDYWTYNTLVALAEGRLLELTDFDGYKHTAAKIGFGGIPFPSYAYNLEGQTLTITMRYATNAAGSVNPQEMASLKNSYFGFALMWNGFGSSVADVFITSSQAFGKYGHVSATMNVEGLTLGEWLVVPFFSSKAMPTQVNSLPSGTVLYMIPFTGKHAIEMSNVKYTISLRVGKDAPLNTSGGSRYYIRYNFTILNRSSETLTFNSNTLRIRHYKNKDDDGYIDVDEHQIVLPNISVGPRETYDYAEAISTTIMPSVEVSQSLFESPVVQLYLNSGSEYREAVPVFSSGDFITPA